jgi:prevent-host-death family protein
MSRALSEGPQIITRNGRRAVVVSVEEREKKAKRKGTLVEFFANSPLRGSGLTIEPSRDGLRPIDL